MTSPADNSHLSADESRPPGSENIWPAVQGLTGEMTEAEQTVFFERLAHSSAARQELTQAVQLDDCLQLIFSQQDSFSAEEQARAAAAPEKIPVLPSSPGRPQNGRALPPPVRVLAVPGGERVSGRSARAVLVISVACLLVMCGLLLTNIPVPHSFELAADRPEATPSSISGEIDTLPALLWVELTLSADGSPLLSGEQEQGFAERGGHLASRSLALGSQNTELQLLELTDEDSEDRDSGLKIPEWMLVAVTTAASSSPGDPSDWPGEPHPSAEKQEQ